MLSWKFVWKKVTGDDNLLLKRRFFIFWMECKYINNEIYRKRAGMNECVAKYTKLYNEQRQLVQDRDSIHFSIDNATHALVEDSHSGWMKLPWWSKDDHPMDPPPDTWRKFASVIKGRVPTADYDGSDTVTVQLDPAGIGKDYELQRVNVSNRQKKRQNNQQHQQHDQD